MNQGVRWAAALCALWMAAGSASAADEPYGAADEPYGAADFMRVSKFDAHVHANTEDHLFLDIAVKDGFELLSINFYYPDFPALDRQAQVAHYLMAADPRHFHFATTFAMKGFGRKNWTADTDRRIDGRSSALCWSVVKVWPKIGISRRTHRAVPSCWTIRASMAS